MTDDAQLIQDTLAGDTAAFGQLVCKYQDRLYTSIAHIMGAPEEARDVVQDAFVQAFTKLETFRGSAAFYTWLYRIAFNLSVSRRRRKRPTVSIEHTREVAGTVDGVEPVDTASPSDRLVRSERAAQVQQAMAALGDEHREILVLREIEGFDYERIADVLDIAVGTVRSRLHRARMQLREQLVGVMQEDIT